eukprot:749557-Hanusia_phi.AAC.1
MLQSDGLGRLAKSDMPNRPIIPTSRSEGDKAYLNLTRLKMQKAKVFWESIKADNGPEGGVAYDVAVEA